MSHVSISTSITASMRSLKDHVICVELVNTHPAAIKLVTLPASAPTSLLEVVSLASATTVAKSDTTRLTVLTLESSASLRVPAMHAELKAMLLETALPTQ